MEFQWQVLYIWICILIKTYTYFVSEIVIHVCAAGRLEQIWIFNEFFYVTTYFNLLTFSKGKYVSTLWHWYAALDCL